MRAPRPSWSSSRRSGSSPTGGGLSAPSRSRRCSLAAYLAVLRLSSLEQMLVADAAHASRAVLYELPRGSALAAPIEPGTEIIRLAMHAYVHDAELPLGKRRTKLHVVEEGSRGRKVEDVNVDLPGERTRVTSDEPGLSIGDPVAIDFDVHDLGAGELTVTLTGIDKADGLLVRMYRRESLSLAKASARNSLLDRQRKNHLARWTWELAWDEASASEQEEYPRRSMAPRRRVAWLRTRPAIDCGRARPAARRITHARAGRQPGWDDPARGRASCVRHTQDDDAARLLRPGRDTEGHRPRPSRRRADAQGVRRAVISSTDAGDESVEIAVGPRRPPQRPDVGPAPGRLVRLLPSLAREPRETESLSSLPRRLAPPRDDPGGPSDRSDTTTVGLEAVVDVTGPTLRPRSPRDAGRATALTLRPLRSLRPDGGADRALHVLRRRPAWRQARSRRPGRSRSTSRSRSSTRRGRTSRSRRAALDEPPPRLEVLGADSWGGFVPRRPSNAADFDVAQRPLIRIARHFVATDAPTTTPTLIRFASGGGAGLQHDGLVFERVGPAFHAEVGGQRPLLLPFRLLGDAGTRVDVQLRPGADRRPRAGISHRVTLPERSRSGLDRRAPHSWSAMTFRRGRSRST